MHEIPRMGKLFLLASSAVVIVGPAARVLTPPAFAHHSFAMFDQQKDVSIEGTVTDFTWTNPHASITLVAPHPETGVDTEWWFEMSSLGGISRGGWRRDTVKPGDEIIVNFHPLKDGAAGGQFRYAVLPDGRTLGQVDAGFSIANPGGDEEEVAKEEARIQRARERRGQGQQPAP